MRSMTTGGLCVAIAVALGACSDPAKEDLRQVAQALDAAGEALDHAIRRSAEDVQPHAEEAGRQMMESLSDARAKLEQTGKAIDTATRTDEEGEPALDPDAVTCVDERYGVSRDVAQEVADAPMSLAAEAGVEETERGSRVTRVNGAGILARLGLREGDVILGVSGLDLQGPMDRPLSERLKSKEVVVTIERDGRRIDKTLVIEGEAPPPES